MTQSLPGLRSRARLHRLCPVRSISARGNFIYLLNRYKSCSAKSSCFSSKATFAILTSEGGSIELRTASEGGGMFGHHGSKAASNMMVKLLSYEFRDKGVTVVGIHP